MPAANSPCVRWLACLSSTISRRRVPLPATRSRMATRSTLRRLRWAAVIRPSTVAQERTSGTTRPMRTSALALTGGGARRCCMCALPLARRMLAPTATPTLMAITPRRAWWAPHATPPMVITEAVEQADRLACVALRSLLPILPLPSRRWLSPTMRPERRPPSSRRPLARR